MLLFELSVRTYLSVLISNVSSVMSFSCNDFAARYFSNFERNFFQGNREDYFMDKEKYSYFIRKYTWQRIYSKQSGSITQYREVVNIYKITCNNC